MRLDRLPLRPPRLLLLPRLWKLRAPPLPPWQRQKARLPPRPAPPAAQDGARIHSSPLVRRMASEHGIDLSTVSGTGAGGRISKQDLEAVIAAGGAPPPRP